MLLFVVTLSLSNDFAIVRNIPRRCHIFSLRYTAFHHLQQLYCLVCERFGCHCQSTLWSARMSHILLREILHPLDWAPNGISSELPLLRPYILDSLLYHSGCTTRTTTCLISLLSSRRPSHVHSSSRISPAITHAVRHAIKTRSWFHEQPIPKSPRISQSSGCIQHEHSR